MYKRRKPYDLSYTHFVGSWAWLLHRLSGLALIFYLCLHVWVIHTLTLGPESFNRLMAFLTSPLFRILEAGLWGVILYHAFNGVRVIVVDFFGGSLSHKKLFLVLIAVAFLLWAAGSAVIIGHIH
ncbi:MAG: succinate dehydrogenase, cytochrome b556 subunit [Candidatus Aminicenantes bacterium]|nr:succinate dehydrogenase, cytochrome b556 subunit [Candidatus Aminicenantes bacterium]